MADTNAKEKMGKIVKEVKFPPIDLIALTAHQLKKPLSSTMISLQMLLSGDFGGLTEEQKEVIGKILDRNKTLICLVDDLLVMAKNDKGGHNNLNLVDIKEMIESVIKFEEEEIKNKKINLKFQKPNEDYPKIMLDKEKMYVALQNIIENALSYTPAGGSITVTLKQEPKELQIAVSDSGMGIPENQKEKIFTKFFRGINAVQAGVVGSGLGLFISKNIIEGHGGKIWFESEENQGTTFYITLPIQ